jgi:hypothetical protein
MGIWGAAYGPEGRLAQALGLAPFAIPENQMVSAADATYSWHCVQSHLNTALPRAQDHPLFYVGVYTLISLGIGVVTVLSFIVLYVGAYRASRLLFEGLLNAVIHATMRWHVRP